MTNIVFGDRIKVATATTGMGTATPGAASSNAFLTFAEGGIADGNAVTVIYEEGNDFEISRGIYNSAGPTVTRATVLASKIGGTAGTSKMTLAGAATMRVIVAAADMNERGSATVSSVAPTSPKSTDLWYDLESGQLFIYVNDGSSSQWVNWFNDAIASVAYSVGGTDVAVTDGGTGASTASGARTNLGVAVGTGLDVAPAQAYKTRTATTSGTSVTQTGIPAGATKITMFLEGVSTTGISPLQIRLGPSGGVETSGYVGLGNQSTTTALTGASYTAGLGIHSLLAANVVSGKVVWELVNAAANTWQGTFHGHNGATNQYFSSSLKSCASAVDRISITTVGGTDTFDAGNITVVTE